MLDGIGIKRNKSVTAYVENDDEQEVYVGNVVKLQPNVVWHEGECCIFGGANFVPGISGSQMTVLVSFRFRDGNTKVDPAIRPL